MNEALINAIRDGRDVVTWGDIVKAKQLKDLGPPEDVEYIERERHATALHEACHAVVAYRVRHHLVIDIATIEKGGNYLGMVSSIPPEDLFTRWRSDYEADVMVSLASLAGEKMFFGGDSSSGVSGDLESATQLAIFMEGYWGMGQTIASHGVTHRVGRRWRAAGRAEPDDEARSATCSKVGLGERIEEKLAGALRAHRAARARQPRAGARGHARARDEQDAHRRGHRGRDRGRARARSSTAASYGTPEFEGIAEAYHAEVLDAHARHGKVEVPLPKLNGQRGDIGPLAELDPQRTKGNGGTTADEPAEEETEPTA